ncbi:hypothetical protein KIW84_036075 [Lathyrus oleraceus]|uniref:Uncharacterized protein n=1 Tax=Pisum sativum TaxID=3888 RepID=A0A9D5B7L8_PEA|nr:hypothetical protein KIW84_036075 [Pisum sativum]
MHIEQDVMWSKVLASKYGIKGDCFKDGGSKAYVWCRDLEVELSVGHWLDDILSLCVFSCIPKIGPTGIENEFDASSTTTDQGSAGMSSTTSNSAAENRASTSSKKLNSIYNVSEGLKRVLQWPRVKGKKLMVDDSLVNRCKK